jgi:DNA-binding SARP family transcriptional activator
VLAITLLLIMRALVSHGLLVLKLRRQQQVEAFSERVAPGPMPRLTLQPTYADQYAMTLPLQPYNGGHELASDPEATEASDSRRQHGVETIQREARSSLSIAVLGPLEINGAQPIKRAATNEMIAFLALHPAGATRDELTEALWPGQDPKRTHPRLYQSVSDARRAFGSALVRDRERYQLDRTRVCIDLDMLHELLAAGDDESLEAAVSLWRGRPLAGTDFLWAEAFVHELHAALLDLLGRVASARLSASNPRGALEAAERAITIDNLHEPSWCLALRADHALGLHSGVTKRYDALSHLLDEQLGLQPSRDTRMLYRELLGQT